MASIVPSRETYLLSFERVPRLETMAAVEVRIQLRDVNMVEIENKLK